MTLSVHFVQDGPNKGEMNSEAEKQTEPNKGRMSCCEEEQVSTSVDTFLGHRF